MEDLSIEKIQAGDEDALKDLFTALLPRVRHIAFRYSGRFAKAWLIGILSLPTEIAVRLAQRRPVAEIHKLQQDIPGPRALDKDLHDLFGNLKSEKIP